MRWEVRIFKRPDQFLFQKHFLPLLSFQYLPSQDLTSSHLYIHLGPKASNISLLLSSKMHHGVLEVSMDHRWARSKSVLLLLCLAFYSSSLAPSPLILPMKWDYWSRVHCHHQGWGQGKVDICVTDSVRLLYQRNSAVLSPASTMQLISQASHHHYLWWPLDWPWGMTKIRKGKN